MKENNKEVMPKNGWWIVMHCYDNPVFFRTKIDAEMEVVELLRDYVEIEDIQVYHGIEKKIKQTITTEIGD